MSCTDAGSAAFAKVREAEYFIDTSSIFQRLQIIFILFQKN